MDVETHFKERHLCIGQTDWNLHLQQMYPHKDPILLGWLQIDVPNINQAGKIGLHNCIHYCTHKAAPKHLDCQASPGHDCCISRKEKTRQEAALNSLIVGRCDTKRNCFTGNYGAAYEDQHIGLDNDCIGARMSPSEWTHCAFYDADFREHFISRVEHMQLRFKDTASPVLAAVQESMLNSVESLGPEVPGLVMREINRPHNINRQSNGGTKWIPQVWGLNVSHGEWSTKPSHIDRRVIFIKDRFKTCPDRWTDEGGKGSLQQ
jgi:hypothetical protein